MKKCTKCSCEKQNTEFYKNNKNKSGLHSWCKKCEYKYDIKRRRTQEGCLAEMYYCQKSHSKSRKQPYPTYTLKWFIAWGMAQQKYLDYYKIWKDNGYKRMLRPSCDRINDYIWYTEDNIQIMSWAENHKKCGEDMINGINTKSCKAVEMISNDIVTKFISARAAYRSTGISYTNISACCNGRRKYAGGSEWRYVNNK